MEITSEDMKMIYEMRTDIAVIKSKMENLPEQEPRPCEYFKKHIEEHHSNNDIWKTALISNAVSIGKTVLVALAGMAFAYVAMKARGN